MGAAIGQRLAPDGAVVTLVGRDRDALEASAQACGSNAQVLQADVASAEGRARLIETVGDSPPAIVVAAVHQRTPWRSLRKVAAADVSLAVERHLAHVVDLLPVVLESQRREGFGRWIVISSAVAAGGGVGQMEYIVQKNALEGLARSIAVEGGPWGITANIVSPGFIENRGTRKNYDAQAFRTLAGSNVVGRAGMPEEVAHVVAALAAPLGGYVTGATIPVDGGWHLNWFGGAALATPNAAHDVATRGGNQ